MFRRSILFLAIVWAMPIAASGQASPFIPLDDPIYADVRAAQVHGLMTELNPNRLPYTYREVADAAGSTEHPLAESVRAALSESAFVDGAGFMGRGGIRKSTHGRMDPMRYLDRGGEPFFPYAEAGLHWARERVIARGGFRFDYYWERDPDGLDATLRAYMRNDQSYAGLQSRWASVHVGRIATHWGLAGSPGLMVSDNPRSFDALHIRLGSDRVSMQSVIGELDSITGDGRFTGTAGDDSVASGSERRWMAAHRLDWRPTDRLQISVLEAALYSGPSSGLSLKYLNPTQFMVLAVDNRPKNDENNALLGLSVWARPGRWTMEYQIMFDDFDLLFGNEPASLAASAVVERPVASRTSLRASLSAVTSRTYNTFQPEGRWMYLNRGIATQFSDYATAELRAVHLMPEPGLRLEPYLGLLLQGERDLRDPYRFGDDFETLLTGTVERSVRAAVRATATRGGRLYATLDLGLNRIDNMGHIQGRTANRIVGRIEVAFRLDAPRRGQVQ